MHNTSTKFHFLFFTLLFFFIFTLLLISCKEESNAPLSTEKIIIKNGTKLVILSTFLRLDEGIEGCGIIDAEIDSVKYEERLVINWVGQVSKELPDEKGSTKSKIDTLYGHISSGFLTSDECVIPCYWQKGEYYTNASLLWLSKKSFKELKEKSFTEWTLSFLKEPPKRFNNVKKDKLSLVKTDATVFYTVKFNGKHKSFPVINAVDSFQNEYTILDDENNPLILQVAYNPPQDMTFGFFGIARFLKAIAGYRITEIYGVAK